VTDTLAPIGTASAADVRPPGRRSRRHSVGRSLWWFAVPALAVYVYVVVSPTLQGIAAAFTDWSAFNRTPNFIGFENFVRIFQSDLGEAAFRTVLIAVVTMTIMNVFGLLLALVLHQPLKGRNFLRTLVFVPVIVSPLVVGYLFKYIFGPPDVGVANSVLEFFGLPQVDWLGQPTTALWIIIIVVCWQFTGAAMVIYLAGLQSVPQELVEAAAIDGAGSIQRFWHIVRPLLAPAFTINLMLGLIGGLKIFDQIFALTAGGPAGSTHTISTLIYQQFTQFGYWGRSAALAVILALGVALLSSIQFTALRRQEKAS
jgi:raffinose/stachyose/melibiose transport system permease protein